jgi:hypothetical protein
MKNIAVRVATVLFALSVVATLVVHASVTSGCTKTEPVRKDEPQNAPTASASAPTPPATETATASATTTAIASATPSASSSAVPAPPKAKPAAGNVSPSNVGDIGTSGGYMPASKSGGVFRPKSDPAPQQQAPNANQTR